MSNKRQSKTPVRLASLAPGLSLRQLSKRSKVTMPHLSRVFSRKRRLTLDVAVKIAAATGKPLDAVVKSVAA